MKKRWARRGSSRVSRRRASTWEGARRAETKGEEREERHVCLEFEWRMERRMETKPSSRSEVEEEEEGEVNEEKWRVEKVRERKETRWWWWWWERGRGAGRRSERIGWGEARALESSNHTFDSGSNLSPVYSSNSTNNSQVTSTVLRATFKEFDDIYLIPKFES